MGQQGRGAEKPSPAPQPRAALTIQLLHGDVGQLLAVAAGRERAVQVIALVQQASCHMVEWHLLPATRTGKERVIVVICLCSMGMEQNLAWRSGWTRLDLQLGVRGVG